MEAKKGIFYGAIEGYNDEKKTVEAVILHFGTPNENFWTAMPGCLDAFLERINNAGKGISACYQHDDRVLIGRWLVTVEGDILKGTLYLSDTPFVRETVIPQLKDGTLQGSSPSIGASSGTFNNENGIYEIIEGAVGEISLVGLPADLDANITKIAASLEARRIKNENFEIDLLTL